MLLNSKTKIGTKKTKASTHKSHINTRTCQFTIAKQVYSVNGFPEIIHHSVVCLTTGPKPLPKPALYIVRSRASSFKWEYPLLFLRSSNSFLRLLPCLPVNSIPPCIFPPPCTLEKSIKVECRGNETSGQRVQPKMSRCISDFAQKLFLACRPASDCLLCSSAFFF